jgi:hypothetical protein
MFIENPGIRDIHGNEVLFILIETDLSVRGISFQRVYFRDCSDGGLHALSLNRDSENLVRDFLEKKNFEENIWVSDYEGLWVELRIENEILLCFIWDCHTKPRSGVSKTTYITEDYWNSWQDLKKKYKF